MKRRILLFVLFAIVLIPRLDLPGRAQSLAADFETGLQKLKAHYHKPEVEYPDANPYSRAKYDLGMSLFFDPALSRSKTMSCASCHNPSLAWGDGMPRAVGDLGEPMARRAPTLLNVAYLDILGWIGQFPSLEGVTFTPITAHLIMNLDQSTLLARLQAEPEYRAAFAAAFGDDAVSRSRIEDAIATFERGIISSPAPFDRWLAGDPSAITDSAKRGFELFNGRARCAECHAGWAFTDGSFHDIGTATGDDRGRGTRLPTSIKLQHAFKTPTLRDVAKRAPYMHNGSVRTLDEVIDLYDRGGIDRPSRASPIAKLNLSPEDKADLLAFLGTLTSDPSRGDLSEADGRF